MPWERPTEIKIESEIIDPFTCPICKSEDCVPPAYNYASNVLWVGESPGEEEVRLGKPFVGQAGKVLQAELKFLGLSMYNYRMCNLWLHPPLKNKKDERYEKCFEHSIKTVLTEAKNKDIVVLVGSETVKYFTGEKVSDWNGLLVKSTLLSNPYVLAMIQPATAFRGSCGELRFALRRFEYYLGEIK